MSYPYVIAYISSAGKEPDWKYGGIGAAIKCGKHKKEISKSFRTFCTPAQLEMVAMIEVLKSLTKTCNIVIYTESKYMVRAINDKMIDRWKDNEWIKADGEEVKNISFWKKLDTLIANHNCVSVRWSSGVDNPQKKRSIQLANEAMQEANVFF